jgi:hypothetical protein
MKDLFVLVADADMLAVFRAILNRPDAMGIRPITFEVDRHPYRDPGVFRDGPELLRTKSKGEFRYFITALDHDGSGCNKQPDECAWIVQDRLDSFTYMGRSIVVVIAPELEEWLWRDRSAISHDDEFDAIGDPKERLRRVFVKNHQRGPRPRDFEQIAIRADLQAWNSSPSFRILKETLQNWFPRT